MSSDLAKRAFCSRQCKSTESCEDFEALESPSRRCLVQGAAIDGGADGPAQLEVFPLFNSWWIIFQQGRSKLNE